MTTYSNNEPMSDYLRLVNEIKRNLDTQFLTASQKKSYKLINKHIEEGEYRINLFGPSNSGKTFLNWMLVSEYDYKYYHNPTSFFKNNQNLVDKTVILDHGDYKRDKTRRVRNFMDIKGIKQIIYTSISPAEEIYPRIKLKLNEDEQKEIMDIWENFGFKKKENISSLNNWIKVLRGILNE